MTVLGIFPQLLLYISATLVSLFLCTYVYFSYSFTYWKRKGAPYLKPKFPLGNNDCFGAESLSYGLETVDWYKEAKEKGHKIVGTWNYSNPVLLLIDPEVIKNVLVKDFNHFTDRDFFHNPKHDPKNESIFVAENEEWRQLRQRLSPVFSTAKMRVMFELVNKCAAPMMQLFESYSQSVDPMDIKDVVAMFTTDVISCVAFGLDAGSFNPHEAKFRLIGRKFFESNLKTKMHLIIGRINVKVAQFLGMRVIPDFLTNFFTEVIAENARFRQENNVRKADLMQLLLDLYESSKGQDDPFTFDNFVGNVIVFFLAGFDTSSTTMQYALYELARNPDLQEKTRVEIETVLKKHGGHLTYESFQDMTYLRQVIDETLRLYPPVQNVARFCVKPYTFKGTNVTVEKGVSIVIPLVALGRDPDHYPDPERFDPDRFSSQNKDSINKFAYIPFGEGPRNCIGKRFGLMQASIGLIEILKTFKITISSKTKMPLKLKRGVFLMQPVDKLYVNATKI
uniref:Cytochrome P450 CYP6DJ2v1 n=1 Tax=Dendroctonus rhizophagus TaxID=77169 RepID=G3CLK2_9CUCU|nr:cytochrome P450 CYP6DJ2v1 [Dendroctonus rhizophagus]UUB32644.1 cytochrome P450 CYP6DJ2 [Dendroctonus rhizophagus]